MKKKISSSAPVGSLTLLRDTLSLFLEKGIPADRVLNEIFRRYKLRDERVRAELASRFYGIIRYWRPLSTALGKDSFQTVNDVKLLVDTYHKWKSIYRRGGAPSGEGQVSERLVKYSRIRKMRESYPDWLDAYAEKELGPEHWDALSNVLNREPVIYLRTNTLRGTRDQLLAMLRKEGVEANAAEGSDEAIVLNGYYNVFSLDSFREGFYEVQDISSQLVSHFLQARPGMRVLDACAGNGGKTLHLAALMQNRGKIIATDISEHKLEELRSRSTRNKADLIETRLIPKGKPAKRMDASFDRVLLDVPCSGTGVLRRNPDIRWRLLPGDMTELLRMQHELLENGAAMVKKGGKIVYATCSIFPSEGEEQVKAFLHAHPGQWKLDEERRTDPVADNCDGFYMARLEKISD
jgi:16S rRNA (cytosine967-C5)-methyltransferase